MGNNNNNMPEGFKEGEERDLDDLVHQRIIHGKNEDPDDLVHSKNIHGVNEDPDDLVHTPPEIEDEDLMKEEREKKDE